MRAQSEDLDGDGLPDAQDRCPDALEDLDGFEDQDGCPDLDNDQDQILDVDDRCPMRPESYNGFFDEDGCPDHGRVPLQLREPLVQEDPSRPQILKPRAQMAPQTSRPAHHRVVISQSQIQIIEKVYFQPGTARIQARSFALLDQMAEVLLEHPEIAEVEIEGHTDDQGSEAQNLKLSKMRALAVREALIQRGVEVERLSTMGYGELRPIVPNSNPRERARNRRVEFRIKRWLRSAQRRSQIQHRAIAREFPTPKYSKPKDPEEISKDFRTVVHWAPRVQTDAEGRAQLEFFLSDLPARFQIRAEGLAGDLPGRAESLIRSSAPLSVDRPQLSELSLGDELLLPLRLRNNSGRVVQMESFWAQEGLLRGTEPQKQMIPPDGTTLYLPLKASEPGSQRLELEFRAGAWREQLSWEVKVRNTGHPRIWKQAGLLSAQRPVVQSVDLEGSLPKSIQARLTLYPSLLSSLLEGMEGMLRQPHGCFEQTSSSNFPNIMILKHLSAQPRAEPKLLARARAQIRAGDARIQSFADAEGGFGWFGEEGNVLLSAYALWQMSAARKLIRGLDPRAPQRTIRWLRHRALGSGEFKLPPNAQKAQALAFIAFCLGQAEIFSFPELLNRVSAQGMKSEDPYLLALSAQALLNAPGRDDEGRALLQRLLKSQGPKGGFRGTKVGAMGSQGENLALETTALAALAMIRGEAPAESIKAAILWLHQRRRGDGRWGATQATVLSLSALSAYLHSFPVQRASGEVSLYLNDQLIAQKAYQAEQSEPLIFKEFGSKLKAGVQQLKLKLKGKDLLPFSFQIRDRGDPRAKDSSAPFQLSTQLLELRPKQGALSQLRVQLSPQGESGPCSTEKLKTGKTGMLVLRLSLPAGLHPQGRQLKKLKERGAFAAYELQAGELWLYLLHLPACLWSVDLDLEARFPGESRGDSSQAYLYYQEEQRAWAAPLSVEVQR